jgi:release factor glutamine methyltransferase
MRASAPSSEASRRCRARGAGDTNSAVDHVTFNGLPFVTRPGRVMTPRRASEHLVAAAVERVGARPARVVDVGTGSGAIAVALAAAAPNVRVVATDTSRCAVALARANVRRHGLGHRVTVCHGDLLEPVDGAIDLVVANLPYLPVRDAVRYADLAAEPEAAVFAPGDGLDPYRRLFGACAERLHDDASVIIQIHRHVLAATRAELSALRCRLECFSPVLEPVPSLAAA